MKNEWRDILRLDDIGSRRPANRVRAKFVAALTCIALLAGCSSLPGVLPSESLNGGFELKGRAAIRYGDEAATVTVQWRHQAASDDMLITNAIGQGVARISRAGGEVTLETADARRFQAADAESLTANVLGWRLPLSGLPDWLRARARPGLEAQTTLDAEGRLSRVLQDEWQIDYQEYRDGRPVRMQIARPNLEIRLFVDSWIEAPK
jgi:outer membrane lipoprotein LolB